MELQEVWTGTVKLGVISSDMMFKAKKLDELSQQESKSGQRENTAKYHA